MSNKDHEGKKARMVRAGWKGYLRKSAIDL